MFKHEDNNKRSHDSFTGIGILPIRIEAISTFIYTFSLEIEMAKTNNLLLSKLLFAAGLLFLLAIFSVFLAGIAAFFFDSDGIMPGNVAVIAIKGVLVVDKSGSLLTKGDASSTEIVKLIKAAETDANIKAIIFDINSPGGSPVASAEIADQIKKSNKTTVAVIREVGASGSYWAASACNKIFANKNAMVGSIGVIGSYVEYAGLMDRYNLTYRRLVAGAHKDTGTPFKKLGSEEERLLQSKIDILYSNFVSEVAVNRKMNVTKVETLADGFVYLGDEALGLGLIDSIGGMDDAKDFVGGKLNITVDAVEYKKRPALMDLLGEAVSDWSYKVGYGVGDSILASGEDLKIRA